MAEQNNSLGMDKKTMSWFSYVISIISAIIVLATEKNDKEVRAHAWQSLVMGCVFVLGYIVLGIIFAIVGWRAWLAVGWLFSLLYAVWGIGWLVFSVICIMQALNGHMYKVPVIYNLSQKFNK